MCSVLYSSIVSNNDEAIEKEEINLTIIVNLSGIDIKRESKSIS